MVSTHEWIQTLSQARSANRKPIDYNDVRALIASVKSVLKKTENEEVRDHLAKAGIELSNILLK